MYRTGALLGACAYIPTGTCTCTGVCAKQRSVLNINKDQLLYHIYIVHVYIQFIPC